MEAIQTLLTDSATYIVQLLSDFMPVALGALLLFIVGSLIAAAIKKIVSTILTAEPVEKVIASEKVQSMLDKKAGIKTPIATILANTAYWIVMIITLMSIASYLNIAALSDILSKLIAYVPHIIAAIVVLSVALFVSRLVKSLVVASLTTLKASFAKQIGSVVEIIIIVFGVVMAMAQLGFDTTIITGNIIIIVAGIMAAFALAAGMGLKDVVRGMAVKHYSAKTFKVGKVVTIGEHTGEVVRITELGVVLKSGKSGEVFVSHKNIA